MASVGECAALSPWTVDKAAAPQNSGAGTFNEAAVSQARNVLQGHTPPPNGAGHGHARCVQVSSGRSVTR